MKPSVARRLRQLNFDFYQQFAGEFAESRTHVPEGMLRALALASEARSVLEVGCGDGRAALALAGEGWSGRYMGVDASPALLALAQARQLEPLRTTFIEADLISLVWPDSLPMRHFDVAFAFAVLHHIPEARRRARLLRQLTGLVRPGGTIVVSTWQFLSDDRLRRKIVPWAQAGLEPEDVDPGDYLLDWQRGGQGLRYVCALGEAELRSLAQAAGCEVREYYRADGRSGELSLYTVLAAPSQV